MNIPQFSSSSTLDISEAPARIYVYSGPGKDPLARTTWIVEHLDDSAFPPGHFEST